ncbi:hypothetical protein KSF73_14700 [Burkholderiaceae bacterium DAT-1]|nr:hypothetical protein [Burkholderiaceae bacterium DAT-1]
MLLKPRNPHACASLMRKGGAHAPSRKRQRQNGRQDIKRQLVDVRYDKATGNGGLRYCSVACR